MNRLALVLVVVACGEPQHADPVVWPVRDRMPPPVDHDAGADLGKASVELKARVVEVKPDAATGTTLVTIGVGANHGITPEWTGTILDDKGADTGRFTIVDVKPRTTIGATTLAPKLVENKLVRLASP
ncbi:MAG: hypothetical protein ABI867_21040 [Kofleriaceae bacterium]